MTPESNVLTQVLRRFYSNLQNNLSHSDREKINAELTGPGEKRIELGSEITRGVFNFICPDMGGMVTTQGFSAHGNINMETGDIDAVITVFCSTCNKEHPIATISFPEMLAMPFLLAAGDGN